jgi:hypothetical protein
MTVIVTRLTVAADGTFSGRAPQLPPGEHEASLALHPPHPGKPFSMDDFPFHQEPWDDAISLRREDLYDDEGRLR